jgi:OmpA-OmpF porin, OOP family
MDGQRAVVEGVLASEAAKTEAEAVALRAAGPGNQYIGGVTSVDMSDVVVGVTEAPFVWIAELTPSSMALGGFAPTARARRALVAHARTLAADDREVVDDMRYAMGAPSGNWTDVASAALTQLAKLSFGEIRLEDGRLSILGEGDQPSVAAVRQFYEEQPLAPPYRLVSLDLTVEGQGLGIQDLQGMSLAQPQADDCQAAFTVLMRRNVINFVTGSAEIDPESGAILRDLAKVARRCDRYEIQISGHTDDVGDPASNLALSQERAEAVRDYLVGEGVASTMLTPRGFGETEPLAPNTTEANRAQNRRIVFEVR